MTEQEAIQLLNTTCTVSDLYSISETFDSTYIFKDNADPSIITTHEVAHVDIIAACNREIEQYAEQGIEIHISNDLFYTLIDTRERHFALIVSGNNSGRGSFIGENLDPIHDIMSYIEETYGSCTLIDYKADTLDDVYYWVVEFH